ncbi:MAG: cell division protein SepF [Candidatus Bathyarchaeota archaeon]|nr:cell division protein SepF [Candidatus Bathyarchaeota archaeon]MDW8040377.1 cell division protein SepF [Nitrososphaerota archaeon]
MPGLSELFRKYKREEKEKETERKAEETKGALGKTFLKAMPLRDLADLDAVKNEVRSGNILILRITPLANKSIEDVKRAVNELCEFVESVGGDIARLGEERVVVCPPNVKIWREKPQVASEPIPTAA